MIDYLFNVKRFSFFDSMVISSFCILLVQGRFITACVVMLVGPLVAVVVEQAIGKRAMDKKWKAFSDSGQQLMAIKVYRHLYGSSLKQACDAVNKYGKTKK